MALFLKFCRLFWIFLRLRIALSHTVGSVAHAGGRGLESYTGEMIGTVAFVAAKVGEGVEVTPYIAVTLRAVESGEVLSALLDFNSWLLGSGLGLGGELHAIRNAFWGAVAEEGEAASDSGGSLGDQTYCLPARCGSTRRKLFHSYEPSPSCLMVLARRHQPMREDCRLIGR